MSECDEELGWVSGFWRRDDGLGLDDVDECGRTIVGNCKCCVESGCSRAILVNRKRGGMDKELVLMCNRRALED